MCAVPGNCSRRRAPASATIRRLCAVSFTTRSTATTSPSRCFNAMRRSSACRSESRVSASTPTRHPAPSITASHARRSRTPGEDSWDDEVEPTTGLSACHATVAGIRARNRARRLMCAASRTGRPPGNARAERSSPTAANRPDNRTIDTSFDCPRQIRAACCPESPTAAPRSEKLRPAPTRPVSSSLHSAKTMPRPRATPRSTRRWRTGMVRSCETPMHAGLSAGLLRGFTRRARGGRRRGDGCSRGPRPGRPRR